MPPPERTERKPLSQIWTRLRQVFGSGVDDSLHQSLEGVIQQHDAGPSNVVVTPEARAMLLNILEFGALRVDDVMVSRADIISIDETTSLTQALLVFAEANHSRMPVYRETLDEPVGMLHIKDLIGWIIGQGKHEQVIDGAPSSALSLAKVPLETTVKETGCLREVLFVPPSMPAADLLIKMQSTRSHMALVVDEYGGIGGLVTIEDIVDEIVGDIDDEHDDEGPLIQPLGEGVYFADGRMDIDDLEELLKVDLLPDKDDEEVDTVGGLLFSLVGRMPAPGEMIDHSSGIRFEVVDGDPRRVKSVKIHVSPHLARSQNGERAPSAPQ